MVFCIMKPTVLASFVTTIDLVLSDEDLWRIWIVRCGIQSITTFVTRSYGPGVLSLTRREHTTRPFSRISFLISLKNKNQLPNNKHSSLKPLFKFLKNKRKKMLNTKKPYPNDVFNNEKKFNNVPLMLWRGAYATNSGSNKLKKTKKH